MDFEFFKDKNIKKEVSQDMGKLTDEQRKKYTTELKLFRDRIFFKKDIQGKPNTGDIVELLYHNEIGVVIGYTNGELAEGQRYIVITKRKDTNTFGVRYSKPGQTKLLERKEKEIINRAPIADFCENLCVLCDEDHKMCERCSLFKLRK